MRPHHALLVNALPAETRRDIALYFSIALCGRLLSERLAENALGQADCVLALLRLDRMMEVEWLLGRRIVHCPAAHKPAFLPSGSDLEVRSGDDRRIARVGVNTALPTTGKFYRWRIFRPGMTVGQAIVRGVTRRDVRLALRRGMIVLEGVS